MGGCRFGVFIYLISFGAHFKAAFSSQLTNFTSSANQNFTFSVSFVTFLGDLAFECYGCCFLALLSVLAVRKSYPDGLFCCCFFMIESSSLKPVLAGAEK